jgi:hypothetical protein
MTETDELPKLDAVEKDSPMAQAKQKPLFPAPTDIEDDYYAWCYEQAELLRQNRFAEADLPNIVEELEGMGNEQRHALRSSYRLVIAHLLKWQFQPDLRSRSWEVTIVRERINIDDRERASKSLANKADELVAEAYRGAVLEAVKETGLDRRTFPRNCPYSLEQLRDPNWMPE